MVSATQLFRERGGGGKPLLKGSDLGSKETSVKVIIGEARVAPENFNSPVILDFAKPVKDRVAWPVNQTNGKVLIGKLGEDLRKWSGYTLTLTKVRTRNPKTGQPAWGLEITDVSKSRVKNAKAYVEAPDDDVPF